MQDAPSVTCPVGRPFFGGALMAAVWLASVAAALAWSFEPAVAAWRLALGWSAVAIAGVLALRSWLGTSEGVLAWDGNAWSWSEGDGAGAAGHGRLELSIDLQHTILARWHDGGAGRWLWLERRRCPDRWNDVRRAVYSRAGSPARAAEPPAAKP